LNTAARLAPLALSALLAACASSGPSIPTTDASGAPERIPTELYKPEGSGPFPAVVLMHDCSGLGSRASGGPERWAKELVAHGYVVLLPDSFSTRGFPGGVCTDPSPGRNEVNPYRRARDAYAALAYVQTLAYVDGTRVGLMGASHGGSTTLLAMLAHTDGEQRAQSRFSAAVALYPGCAGPKGNVVANSTGAYQPLAPVLILIGDRDDWSPAEPCRRLADTAQKAGYPVAIKVYAGAYHAFDSSSPPRYVAARVNANSPTGRGATTGGNAEAWADSIREVEAFLGRHLAANH
jgi:dienelactone hydrolase